MERLRTLKLTYELDTNKRTEVKTFELGEFSDDEDIGELLKRFQESLDNDLIL